MELLQPGRVKLTLPNGDVIHVRRRLNVGEHSDFLDRIILPTDDPQVNRLKTPYAIAVEKVAAYLLSWQALAPMDPLMPIEQRVETIRQLDQVDFEAIHQAITAHEAAIDLEMTDAKKSQDGASASPIISPSPSDATGAMNGSGNSSKRHSPSLSKSSTPKMSAGTAALLSTQDKPAMNE